jgi:hypothetical protein
MAKLPFEQPKTELIPSTYRALAVPAAQLTAFLKENIGAQGLKPFDLDRVKVPAGGGTTWEVPSLKGPQNAPVLEGIIMHFRDVRSYWKEAFGGGANPPDCASQDGMVGVGVPGGACHSCPLAEFGSAPKKNGKGGRGQACKQIRMMLLLRQDDMVPLLILAPSSSLKAARSFFLRLVSNGLPYYGVTTQLRLTKTKNADGIEYSQMSFAMGRQLEPDEFQKVQVIGQALRDLFSAVTIDAGDVREGA